MDTILDFDIASALNQSGACDYCHKRKMRCDKQKPQCIECLKRSIPCNYGVRLKRGPKAKKQKVLGKPTARTQKATKSSSQLQALLFEVEFNKKMVEIWKSVSLNENGNFSDAKRCRPQFNPATEEFIRSPDAIHIIMTEFDSTYRLVFYLPSYAANIDFATKIWQAMIDISAADLLTMLSTFDSTLLSSMLEYYVAFMLSLKLSKYHDIAEYISRIVNYIFDLLIYVKEDYLNSFELTEKILADLNLCAHYHKLSKNHHGLAVNAEHSSVLYAEAKKKWKIQKDLEVKMICRMIMSCRSEEDRKKYIHAINQYNPAELPAHVLYMANISISMESLHSQQKDIGDANIAIQKASYFAKAFILQNSVVEQGPVERYYDSWTGVVHSEVAIRAGNIELSRSKIGRILEAYAIMPPPLQRLLISNIEYFEFMLSDKTLLIKDFLPMLTKQGVTMTRTLPYAMLLSTTCQQKSDSEEISDSSNEFGSPSNIDQQIGSSSEEIIAAPEFYDASADPFFEFTDFDNLMFSTNM